MAGVASGSRPGIAWIATAAKEFVTVDAARTWKPMNAPKGPGATGRPSFGHELLVAGACHSGTCTQTTSRDPGATWSAETLSAQPVDAQRAAVSANDAADEFAVAPVVPHAAGAMREPVAVTVMTSDGTTRASAVSPASDVLTWVGSSILGIGGSANTTLASTVDGGRTWQVMTTPAGAPPAGQVSEADARYGDPVLVTATEALLPVIRGEAGGRTTLMMLRTRDGKSFEVAGTTTVSADVPLGTVPIAALKGSDVVIVVPGRAEAYQLTGGSISTLGPDSAPVGLESMTFADDLHGLAVTSSGACATDKSDCVTATELKLTDDGGRTWRTSPPPA